MSFGFAVTSGTGGSLVSVNSDNDAVGVFLDYFFVPYNTTVTKSYSSFYGSALFTIVIQQDRTKLNTPTTSINNSTKSVSVTSQASTATARQSGLYVIVLGK
jgi:hypothetical protein